MLPSKSLPWADKPTHHLLKLAGPIVVSSLSAAAMTVVDAMFVGGLGSWALAGVGLAITMTLIPQCLGMGLLTGVKTLVAQARGASQAERTPDYLTAGFVVALAMGVVTLAYGALLLPAVPLLTTDAQTAEAARTYLILRVFSLMVLFFSVALREYRQGHADTRSPVRAGVIANIAHVILAYIFVKRLHGGVFGAGISTLCSTTLEMVLLWLLQKREGGFTGAWSRKRMVEILKMGGPIGIEWTIAVGSFAALSALVSLYGTADMAAHQACLQIIHFGFLPAMAVCEATCILVGEAVGADRDEWVTRLPKIAFAVLGVYAITLTAILLLAGERIASLFSDDPKVIDLAIKLLALAGVWQVFDAAIFTARGALRAAGDVRVPGIVFAVVTWSIAPPAAWFLGHRMRMGVVGAWMGICFEVFVFVIYVWWRLLSKRWKPYANQSRERLQREVTSCK